MAKLKQIWENNPDTPITASNLSKITQNDESLNLLYSDSNGVIDYSDNKIKLRANSKFNLNIKNTFAFFDFNDSLISHDSKTTASLASNIKFRKETPLLSGKSLALETGTVNKIVNGDFSNNLANWISDPDDAQRLFTRNDGLYNKSAVLKNSVIGEKTTLSQTVDFGSSIADFISISFYYKSNNIINLNFIGKWDTQQPLYWNNNSLGWGINQSSANIILEPSSVWKRVEIKKINTTPLKPINNIKINFINDKIQECSISAVQIEEKEFCSTFTNTTSNETILNYSKDVLRSEKGLIDIEFLPKIFNQESNIIFRLKMNPINNLGIIYSDAMRLELKKDSYSLVFSIYDTVSKTEKQLSKIFTPSKFDELIDNWQRLIISWDKDFYLKFSLNGGEINIITTEFSPIEKESILFFELGGDSQLKFEGLISSLKFNLFTKPTEELILDCSLTPSSDEDYFKVFCIGNDKIIIDSSLLEEGNDFIQSTEYYIYLIDNDLIKDEENVIIASNIVISSSNISPKNISKYFTSIIGGFKTDENKNIVISSLWDRKTKLFPTVMAERFVIHGKDSDNNSIEFKSSPFISDAKFNIPTYVTDNFYGVTGTGINFLNINPNGYLIVDNVKIDSNGISSVGQNDITIGATVGRNVQINSDNVIISSTVGTVQVEGLKIKGQTISPKNGQDIYIMNDSFTSNVIIDSLLGSTFIRGSNHTNQSKVININPEIDYQLNTGTGTTAIDNIIFKTNIISSKPNQDIYIMNDSFTSNVIIDSTTGNNIIKGNQINVEPAVNFQITTGSGITAIDNIVFKSSTISSKTGNVHFDAGIKFVGSVEIGNQTSVESTSRKNSIYNRTEGHFAWYRGGIHNSSLGNPGAGGTVLGLLTGNNMSKQNLGVTIDPNSRFYAGKIYNAVWNDIAECWDKDPNVDLDYGQIAIRTKTGLKPSSQRAEKATIGVVSNTYGYLLGDDGFNEDLSKSKKIPIGISGRVKVKTIGKLEIGDEVVSWRFGLAIKANIFETIFKRARIIGMVDSIINSNECWIKIR